MPKKETDSWTRGNTVKLSYAAKVLNVKQSNLKRLVADGRIRKVAVPFEKFGRIPLMDVLLMLQKEHTALTGRKQKIEEYTGYLGEIMSFYEYQKEKKQVQNMDINDSMIEKFTKAKREVEKATLEQV